MRTPDSLPAHALPSPGYVRRWQWWRALSVPSPVLPKRLPAWDRKMGLARQSARDEAGRLEAKAVTKVKNC